MAAFFDVYDVHRSDVAFSGEDYKELARIAALISIDRLDYLIEVLDKTRKNALTSPSRRILIEVALIQSGMPSQKERLEELQNRIEKSMASIVSLEGNTNLMKNEEELL